MKAIIRSIIKHPFTIMFYLLYLSLVLHEMQTVHYHRELQKVNLDERLTHEYGSFEVIFAIIFGFTMGANSISKGNDETPFYLCMLVLVIIPAIIMVKY